MAKANPSIKFSHVYLKFTDGFRAISHEAVLLQVLQVNLNSLSKEFIEYDTATCDGGHYKLPSSGEYLMLIFKHDGRLFTTLRAAYSRNGEGEKRKYYEGLVGRTFNIIVDAPKVSGRMKPIHNN